MDKLTKRTVATFSIASLLNDIGADMIKPLWPLFITSSLGASAAFLGLLDGIGELLSYLTRFPFGFYADRWKRKPFVWGGYVLACLSRIGYAISGTPAGALFSHAVDRTGKGMRDPPRDAILAAHTSKSERGRAFGTLRGMDSLGAAIGPLAAFLLIPILGLRYLFALAAIPSFIGALLIMFLIKERRKPQKVNPAFVWKELSPEFKRVFWISGFFALSWFSISFMIMYAQRHGVPIVQAPLLYLVFSLTAAAMAYPAGWLSDIIGRKIVLMGGYTLFAITLAAFTLTTTPWVFYALFLLYGLQYGIIASMHGAFVSDVVKEEHRASALGLFQGLWGLCLLPASLIAGILWDQVDPIAPFVFGAGLATIAVLLFGFLVTEK